MMYLPSSSKLNIPDFSHIFDNKSECYKLFWFKAIMRSVEAGQRIASFETLIDEMIADAWYMVTEYHLNLGPNDTLEKVVKRIYETTGMMSSAKREQVLLYLQTCTDKEVIGHKRTLCLNVPYRLQAPFLHDFSGGTWKCGTSELALRINAHEGLIYYFSEVRSLATTITISDDWFSYLYENRQQLCGWIDYNLIVYLQGRNPNVPGIVDKLYPPQERKLVKVGKYWRILSELSDFRDIYGDNRILPAGVSIDHFVPWSYVAHDELWNLNPTIREINSAKSNNLPEWDRYFGKLVDQEYKALKVTWENDAAFTAFLDCQKAHVNSDEVKLFLYTEKVDKTEFGNRLEKILLPVYESAKNSGFREWVYEP